MWVGFAKVVWSNGSLEGFMSFFDGANRRDVHVVAVYAKGWAVYVLGAYFRWGFSVGTGSCRELAYGVVVWDFWVIFVGHGGHGVVFFLARLVDRAEAWAAASSGGGFRDCPPFSGGRAGRLIFSSRVDLADFLGGRG